MSRVIGENGDIIIEPVPEPPPQPPPGVKLTGPGLRVVLERIPGITKKGLLDQPFRFQVPPLDAFRHQHAHSWLDYDTILSGQFSRKGGRQLIVIPFQALFLDWTPTWAVIQDENYLPDPLRVTRDLLELLETGSPFYFTAGQPELWGHYDILDLPMKLTTIDVEERGGEIDARYTDVTFVEYRSPKLIDTKKKGKGRKRSSDKLPSWVQVNENGSARDKSGHHFAAPCTLHKLALHFYGSHGKWKLIAKRNGMSNFAAGRSLGNWARRHRGADKLVIPKAS